MDEHTTKRQGPLFWMARRLRRFWIVAIIVGLPVLYVGSFGPACWISSRVQPTGEFVTLVYRPVLQIMAHGPLFAARPITHYMAFFLYPTQAMAFKAVGDPTIQFVPGPGYPKADEP